MAASADGGARRGLGCMVFAFLGLVGLGISGMLLAGLVAGNRGSSDTIIEISEETRADAHKKVVIIPIQGVMLSGMGRRNVTENALRMLDHARKDESVAGVLLQIDSPGGSVTDADLIYERVKRLREAKKAVVVLMGDICASGGYYVAVAADEIWAHPTTITGSIGVIIPHLNAHDLLARYGVQDRSIMSGANKAMLSATRAPNAEHEALLQEIVDSLYERFVTLVAQGRGLTVEEVRPVADGRILTAEGAKAARLIDGIGYEAQALTRVKKLAKGSPFNVVRYQQHRSFLETLQMRAEAPTSIADRVVGLFAAPRALYLYAPLGF